LPIRLLLKSRQAVLRDGLGCGSCHGNITRRVPFRMTLSEDFFILCVSRILPTFETLLDCATYWLFRTPVWV
jgi:hypothetical protein